MSHLSKLPPEEKAKVDTYIADVASRIRAAMTGTPVSQRQALEDTFLSRIIDDAGIKRGGQAYINAAEQLKNLCRNFQVVKNRTSTPGVYSYNIYYKPQIPCEKIDVKLDINANMQTLQQKETQAILAMADQLEATQKEVQRLKAELESVKKTSYLWQLEAERWREISLQ